MSRTKRRLEPTYSLPGGLDIVPVSSSPPPPREPQGRPRGAVSTVIISSLMGDTCRQYSCTTGLLIIWDCAKHNWNLAQMDRHSCRRKENRTPSLKPSKWPYSSLRAGPGSQGRLWSGGSSSDTNCSEEDITEVGALQSL